MARDAVGKNVARRSVLAGALATGAAAALTGASAARASTPSPAAPRGFHGAHQAGVLTPKRRVAAFVSFDVTAGDRAGLADLFGALTDRVRTLTAGGVPEPLGISAPPADSGVLGPVPPGGLLTALVAVGASLFDERFGLAAQRPVRLGTMPAFPDDDLDPSVCHGDLLLQLEADDTDVIANALRDIARHTRGAMQVRWRIDGFASPPRPVGTPRNLMGFRDGTANPDTTDTRLMDQLLWVDAGQGEPAWATDGSYLAVRLIRMLVEFWDRVGITEQERMFGRRKDSGAPLDGQTETDTPDFGADPTGDVIPMDSHMRLANPRTAQTAEQRLLRRGFNYDRGTDADGNLDMGLVFCAFQQDLERQFVTVQKRLAGEPLVDYIRPFGGGYFFVLPGVRDANDRYARGLLG
ncbi:iron uptake transporter deferrochelatase/peroxidase subunit [Streptacidiphilus melanogenes]|uniref:iron uptake transporter deferrochelatase/peroxidase subunit n=1 Tax=Streptacidiphilus melanogenes TaxID=411235 RepID=UPI0006944727|nr:iron uptake transporter deferrochelatase/peroxidase subunit [Streptacidiphilus melanogenes]